MGERGAPDEIEAAVRELVTRALPGRPTRLERVERGLGSRIFIRVLLDGEGPASAIARVTLPEDPALRPAGALPEPPLEPLRTRLEEHGLPVPRCYAIDSEAGIELLEDAGSTSLQSIAAELPAAERLSLYTEACSWIPRLQAVRATAAEIPAFGRRLDEALFLYKAEQVVEWVLPWALERSATPSEAEVVREAFLLVAHESDDAPARLSHRDYKAANLHVRPARPGVEGNRLVMIDLQGAFLAPPEYDLVCLLRDGQVALPSSEVALHLERIRPALPDAPSPEAFHRRFELLTLTRNGKDLARFLYALQERGDERYRPWLPRLAKVLGAAAARTAPWDPRLERLHSLLQQLPTQPVTPVTEAATRDSDSRKATRNKGSSTCGP